MSTLHRLLAALLLAYSAMPAAAAEPIAVTAAWVRATPPGAVTAAAYLTLTNTGAADKLVEAATPSARAVELHTHVTTTAGVTTMQAVGDIALPATATVEFAPGGLHLMLLGLTGPLEPGAQVRLTLRFERAGELTFDVPVRDGRGAAHRH